MDFSYKILYYSWDLYMNTMFMWNVNQEIELSEFNVS